MVVVWRGAGCLAFLLGIGLLVLSAYVGFGVVLGLASVLGGWLCCGMASQDAEQGQSSDLYFIPLRIWGWLFILGGIMLTVWGVFRWILSGFPDPGLPDLGGAWWWVGWGCGGVTLLFACCIAGLIIVDIRKKNRAIRLGDHTFAWLVYAKEDFFVPGWRDDFALVVVSPETLTGDDERRMADLADRVLAIRATPPEKVYGTDKNAVFELMRDLTYVEGKRDRLPDSITDGREVYLAHLYVYREHLPTRCITSPRIPCAILWHEPNSLICTRPCEE